MLNQPKKEWMVVSPTQDYNIITTNYKKFMKKIKHLSKQQREDLLIEWNLYSSSQRKPILDEFRKLHNGDYTQDDFLQFLRDKLEIDGYWEKSGIA